MAWSRRRTVFATHGAWVSAVAKWARANLTTLRVGQIVRAAASIQGKSAAQGEHSSAEASHENNGKGQGRGRGK